MSTLLYAVERTTVQPVFLDASLYLAGDSVEDAALVDAPSAALVECSLEPLIGSSYRYEHIEYGGCEGELQALEGSAYTNGTGEVNCSLGALIGHGFDAGVSGGCEGELQALEGSAYTNGTGEVNCAFLPLDGFAYHQQQIEHGDCEGELQALTSSLVIRTLVHVDVQLHALTGVSSETVIEGSHSALEPLTGSSRSGLPRTFTAVSVGYLYPLTGISAMLTGGVAEVDSFLMVVLTSWSSDRSIGSSNSYIAPLEVGYIQGDNDNTKAALARTYVRCTDVARCQVAYPCSESFALDDPLATTVSLHALTSDTLTLSDPVRFALHQLLGESVSLTDLTLEDVRRLALAAEMLRVFESVTPITTVSLSAADSLSLTDWLFTLTKLLISEGLVLTDEATTFKWLKEKLTELLELQELPTTQLSLSALAADSFVLNDLIQSIAKLLISEGLVLTDEATTFKWLKEKLTELFSIQELPTTQLSLSALASDTLTLDDLLKSLAAILVAEGLALADEATTFKRLRERLREAAIWATDAASTATIAQRLLESLVAADVAAYVQQARAAEVLALADTLTHAITALLTAPEAVALYETVAASLVVVRTGVESVGFDDASAAGLVASLLVSERIAFIGRMQLGDEVFSAWVLNTDTLGATRYTQFPMLALATHHGRTYGITETGLYELTGETDDGEPISAAIETGDLDFALHQDKNIPRAYLYLWAEGMMRLRTISSKRGCREEAWYEITPMTGTDEQSRIVRLARGVRGTTWQFRIENVDGCDFDLRGAEVLPVVLSKRGAR